MIASVDGAVVKLQVFAKKNLFWLLKIGTDSRRLCLPFNPSAMIASVDGAVVELQVFAKKIYFDYWKLLRIADDSVY